MPIQDNSSLTPDELNLALETLIDRTSLRQVVACLVAVAEVKATHVRDSWQDRDLAAQWQRAARQLERAWKGMPNV